MHLIFILFTTCVVCYFHASFDIRLDSFLEFLGDSSWAVCQLEPLSIFSKKFDVLRRECYWEKNWIKVDGDFKDSSRD